MVFLVIAGSTVAQEPRVAKLTLEERLERRNDPKDMLRRAYVSARQSTATTGRSATFVINGAEDPELFLPFELITMLVGDLNRRTAADLRRLYDPELRAFHWDSDLFWSDLTASSKDYMRLNGEVTDSAPSEELSKRICSARADALNEMRRKYPKFDDFLYAAEAPRHTIVSDDILSADWLRWLEGGCK
jgi:hypothetical protein